MARDHGRVLCAIWRDKDFRQRTPGAQRLYMLLLSQSNVNNAGVLPLQVTKWAKGCDQTSSEDIQSALDELSEHRFVFYDEDTEEALIRSYMRNDGVMKHKYIWTNALRCAEHTESPALREALAEELLRTRRKDAEAVAATLIGMPPEPDPDGIPIPPESDPDDQCHSDAIEITRGRGKGKGLGEPSVTTQVGEDPRPECPDHETNYEGGACLPCKRRREWDKAHPDYFERQKAAEKRQRAAERQKAIDKCTLCDEFGDITFDNSVRKCDHQAVRHA